LLSAVAVVHVDLQEIMNKELEVLVRLAEVLVLEEIHLLMLEKAHLDKDMTVE
jgi:hypothetical protein